ncbi:hypothetical protein SAMN05216241_10783 [Limimonas halophila]|uniref:Pyridoxal phosphate homeostasis protein n=1 Tax=Limimonas halophila TaxID=1082479 RepID=A0A1G7SNI1_9PROT|nr:YggS family pyridoxal phosphate-dependent enzyme [Limimonas halophila]SDG24615.1 hypothetical protein SAMN05216241_10783 [Limimonas halophila]
MSETTPDIAANLAAIHDRIADACRAVGRDPRQVELVAVSKKHPAERVQQALAAGHRVFGENRVQEAQGKYPALRQAHPDLRLHLVGPLQTNKVEDAVATFDVIQTVDRERLARALAKAAAKTGHTPTVYVQVNTGEEPQKAGVAPGDADALVALCRELGLPVAGLMCIPPLDEEPAPHFALLAEIAARLELPALSMGMSGDYETALRLGATCVRVGTAVFGERPE